MMLSADMFNQIVASLTSASPASRAPEKRVQGRVGLRSALEIIPIASAVAGAKPISVWLRDISINGLGIVSSVKMEDSLVFAARFPREGGGPLAILYKVRHCRRISGDLFSVGASFERVVPDVSGEIALIGKASKTSRAKTASAA
jgi:hypothetical protein